MSDKIHQFSSKISHGISHGISDGIRKVRSDSIGDEEKMKTIMRSGFVILLKFLIFLKFFGFWKMVKFSVGIIGWVECILSAFCN